MSSWHFATYDYKWREENYNRMLEAVQLSIRCGNSTSAYVYARLAARYALDTVLPRD